MCYGRSTLTLRKESTTVILCATEYWQFDTKTRRKPGPGRQKHTAVPVTVRRCVVHSPTHFKQVVFIRTK